MGQGLGNLGGWLSNFRENIETRSSERGYRGERKEGGRGEGRWEVRLCREAYLHATHLAALPQAIKKHLNLIILAIPQLFRAEVVSGLVQELVWLRGHECEGRLLQLSEGEHCICNLSIMQLDRADGDEEKGNGSACHLHRLISNFSTVPSPEQTTGSQTRVSGVMVGHFASPQCTAIIHKSSFTAVA